MKLASLGADVAVICASNKDKAEAVVLEARAYGVRAEAFLCDVSDFNAVGDTVKAIKEQLGPVDILVNNAGITRDGLVMSMKEEAFDSVIDINLKGAFNMIHHCTPMLIKKRCGKIVNISSISGIMGNAGQANYSASKAGIIGLTKAVARELAGRNVCCNAIAPGFIETDMTQGMEDSAFAQQIPLKRMGKAEEVAELAAFLVQDISGYITGEVIRIDGGLAI